MCWYDPNLVNQLHQVLSFATAMAVFTIVLMVLTAAGVLGEDPPQR